MGFESEAVEGFDAMLDVLRDGDLTKCVMRYPVTRAGADTTGTEDYDAIDAPSPDKLELMAGGFLQDYQFSITARRDDFEVLPISGSLFKMNGRVSRVLLPENSKLSSLVVFHCGTPDK